MLNEILELDRLLTTRRGSVEAREEVKARTPDPSEARVICCGCGKQFLHYYNCTGYCGECVDSIKRMLAFKSLIHTRKVGKLTVRRVDRFLSDYTGMVTLPYSLMGTNTTKAEIVDAVKRLRAQVSLDKATRDLQYARECMAMAIKDAKEHFEITEDA